MDIRSDYNKGMILTDIGKKYGIDPRTAKKYATANERSMYPKDTTRPTKIEPYKEMLDELLAEAPYRSVRIQEIITGHGFDGKYTIVKEYIRSRKKDLNIHATVQFETMPGIQGQVDGAHFS